MAPGSMLFVRCQPLVVSTREAFHVGEDRAFDLEGERLALGCRELGA